MLCKDFCVEPRDFIEENKPLTLNQADPHNQNHIGQNAPNVQ